MHIGKKVGMWRNGKKIESVSIEDIIITEDCHRQGSVGLECESIDKLPPVIIHYDGLFLRLIAGIQTLIIYKLEHKKMIPAIFTNCPDRQTFESMLNVNPMPFDVEYIKNITVPKHYQYSKVSPRKMALAAKRYYTSSPRPVVVNKNMTLVDNLTDFFMFEAEGENCIPYTVRTK